MEMELLKPEYTILFNAITNGIWALEEIKAAGSSDLGVALDHVIHMFRRAQTSAEEGVVDKPDSSHGSIS